MATETTGKTYELDLDLTAFNPDACDMIRELVNAKLSELNLIGLQLKVGKCRYSTKQAKFEFTVDILDEETDTPAKIIQDFKTYFSNQNPALQMENENWKFMGHRPRGRTFPFIMLNKKTKQQFKMNRFGVVSRLSGVYRESDR